MIITDEQISAIESKLLPSGCSFNPERRNFIKCLETKDVNACAGSGKTTALIAKLMVLDKYFMPLPFNKGICVLTHTNVAINEVKERLGANSKLLNYPNFFGTIQTFIDQFIAVPMYVKRIGSKPKKIDADFYNDTLYYRLKSCLTGQPRHAFHKTSHILRANPNLIFDCRFKFQDNKIILLKKLNGTPIEINKPRGRARNYTNWTNKERQDVRKYLRALKVSIFKDGILHFDDTYFLSEWYLSKHEAQLRNLMTNRFQFVFIDEMQDSYEHQINIFDKIFDRDNIIFQCIGDPNQAIYSSSQAGQVWQPNNPLSISESRRLSTKIANSIHNVRLEVSESLIGTSREIIKEDGRNEEIPPYILLFDDDKIKDVVNKFKDLIIQYKLHIPETTSQDAKKIKFKAVGWVGADKDKTSTGKDIHVIKHYFEENTYKKESKAKQNFNSLSDYLLKEDCKEENNLNKHHSARNYKNRIVGACLKVLRILDKKQEDGKYYSRTSFWKKIYSDDSFADLFLSKLVSWCKQIVQGHPIKEDVKSFILTDLKDFFNYHPNGVLNSFLDAAPRLIVDNNEKAKNHLEFESDDVVFKIDIATIHSVKGETHTGTLYLETFKNNFETKKGEFLNCLKKNENRTRPFGPRLQEALKMAYVGMSRPTHLLCIAIHRSSLSNLEQDIEELESAGWTVVRLLSP